MAEGTARRHVDFNEDAAEKLREMAGMLEQQDANPFRIQAYRRAADTVESCDRDLRDLLASEGVAGLLELPFIGRGIASSLQELARYGRLSRLDRLRGELDPEDLFQTVPGVGSVLARQIHETLGVDTLEEFEVAAHDGRLERVEGIGPRKALALRASLDSMLRRLSVRPVPERVEPTVEELLDVDEEYRCRVASGDLPLISPRRFNPTHREWLPVLHTERGEWHFTVMFSNTARAHELGRTQDWVVVYFYDSDHTEGQQTVVAEKRGPLKGKRVVRGREAECRDFYRIHPKGR
ncbi:MAG: helix-hairpin-helix domain-containing protein [Gammaproteobacteria bacterium]|nr:helix-hairpin-helix domain-containing protein [Gammaproteobacteria bacterium]